MCDFEGVDEFLGVWFVEIWGNYDYWIFENLLFVRLGVIDGEVLVYCDGYIKLKDWDVVNVLVDCCWVLGCLCIGLCWDMLFNYFVGWVCSFVLEDFCLLVEIENVDWFVL